VKAWEKSVLPLERPLIKRRGSQRLFERADKALQHIQNGRGETGARDTEHKQEIIQAISKKGFWVQIAAEAKSKPEAYSSIPRI
jgi:predicted signal transduction protein with EAL and GGDEF domain